MATCRMRKLRIVKTKPMPQWSNEIMTVYHQTKGTVSHIRKRIQ